MRPNTGRTTVALAIATALALAACEREAGSEATLGQKIDRALDVTQQKLAAAGDKIAQETDDAVSNIKSAAKRDGGNERVAQAGGNGGNGGHGANGAPTEGAKQSSATNGAPANGSTTGSAAGSRGRMGDTAITASIKADFLKDPDLSILKIDVDTREGVVTLNGLADNEEARERAERMASAVKGVREVRNYLVVKRT